jgi:integrase/recombinase XerC
MSTLATSPLTLAPLGDRLPAVKFSRAIDDYITEARRAGRINSDRTEHGYRDRLYCLGEDISNRDPRTVGREEIKRTLARWAHPNTQRHAHAVFISFFDWCMEEGIRATNPARMVRKAKKRPTSVYRLNRQEVVDLMDACRTVRERRIIILGLCVGARNQELRGLQGRHFQRPGFVWLSPDIAKGKRERWVPIIQEAEVVVEHIRETCDLDGYVIPARRPADPPLNTKWIEYPRKPSSPQAIWRTVVDVAKQAGIAAHIHPHLLRHAYGDNVTKYAGLRAAQEVLGHASVETTAGTYTSRPGLDELAISLHGFRYRAYAPVEHPETPVEATTGIEPVDASSEDVEPKAGEDEQE